jgi:hypothetical protein
MAYASGNFGSTGDAQTSLYVLHNITSDATPTTLFLDGSSYRLTIAPDQAMSFDILIVATISGGNQVAGYQIQGLVQNFVGTGAILFIGTPTVTVLGEDNPTWDANVAENTANGSLDIIVTGVSGTTIRWVASVRAVQVTFP